ncbi:MAG: cell division protein FtsQ/DivIB [Muribaculaceae bacterium]
MTKRDILYLCGTAVLLLYTVFAVALTRAEKRMSLYEGVDIEVADSAGTGFVTAADIDRTLGGLRAICARDPRGKINTLALERRLQAMPSVESASVTELNNGRLRLRVKPLVPVLRVMDGNSSYYINAAGKTISSDQGNFVDVPVIVGHFKSGKEVARLVPMFSYIHRHPEYDALVSSVSVSPRGDIIIVPAVTGHVINMGDTSRIEDKFKRLNRFYSEVMPVKGWEYFDTLSVKYSGRVIGTRAAKREAPIALTALADSVADNAPDDAFQGGSDDIEGKITVDAEEQRRKAKATKV